HRPERCRDDCARFLILSFRATSRNEIRRDCEAAAAGLDINGSARSRSAGVIHSSTNVDDLVDCERIAGMKLYETAVARLASAVGVDCLIEGDVAGRRNDSYRATAIRSALRRDPSVGVRRHVSTGTELNRSAVSISGVRAVRIDRIADDDVATGAK